ncbi:ATPase [Candidatus Omnitrophus magneticus]|uniref:ATPase n=1 Tax=Candidatus Omnitrophus magneticus TaxID=1609969 RepID=A0A0F0CP48_9BACT|nr:ATPase [Candidatus Omnitrophus magneticus]
MKKFLFIILLIFVCLACGVYLYRHEIFQYSAESIVRKNLPPYVSIDRIIFDLKHGSMKINGLNIKNPKGFRTSNLAEIELINCGYKAFGGNILNGIEVTDLSASGVLINIERLKDGRLNLNEMEEFLRENAPSSGVATSVDTNKQGASIVDSDKKVDVSKFLKLTEIINLTNAKIIFTDNAIRNTVYKLTFDNIKSKFTLRLNKDYTSLVYFASVGSGNVNEDMSQIISWDISFEPEIKELTMSNRLNFDNVNIVLFNPYYEKFFPFYIGKGLVSGEVICDFDRGNIGSMNTIILKNFDIKQKDNDQSAGFWNIPVNDITKYLATAPGEITFDFKVKGTIKEPRFFIGPVVQKAIQSAAIDKLAGLFSKENEANNAAIGNDSASNSTAQKSDTEKVVDLIKGLMNR